MGDPGTPYCEVGMVGLGVMGRNLLLNIADHSFPVAGYDQDPAKVEALRQEAGTRDVQGVGDLKSLVALLRPPRALILLVPAGAPVDAVSGELRGLLEDGDLIIDSGNSHFKDTDRREDELKRSRIGFLGVGISGGERGAREGASIMAGGTVAAYDRIRPVLEAVAAKVGGEPCVAHLGPGSTGHFVKMVHNGIEYGLIQLLAESYDLMKRGLGLDNAAMQEQYETWNRGELSGYLVEITARILGRPDDLTEHRLIDEILPVARQKGTGMWTSQIAMDLQTPIPTIDSAVAMRNLSALEEERNRVGPSLARPIEPFRGDRDAFLSQLQQALHAGMILTYAQGFAILPVASREYHYTIDLAAVARIWRGGCIIRAALLEPVRAAFEREPGLPNLLLDPTLAEHLQASEAGLREVVATAIRMGLPLPGLASALTYLDSYRSPWLPANLIQAQRDYFGAHTYERSDRPGTFHTEWEQPR